MHSMPNVDNNKPNLRHQDLMTNSHHKELVQHIADVNQATEANMALIVLWKVGTETSWLKYSYLEIQSVGKVLHSVDPIVCTQDFLFLYIKEAMLYIIIHYYFTFGSVLWKVIPISRLKNEYSEIFIFWLFSLIVILFQASLTTESGDKQIITGQHHLNVQQINTIVKASPEDKV